MKKQILAALLSVSMLLQTATPIFADTVSISVVENPNMDILLTTGDFTSDLSNLEADIRAGLEADGINTKNIEFQTIETSVTSTDSMSPSTIFNEWGRIGLPGSWSLSTVDGKTSIRNSENTAGITSFYYKDSYNYKNMTIEFDVKTTDTDDDSIGVFLRFNLGSNTTESTTTQSKRATGYLYIEEIGPDTHVLPNGLYKITDQVMPKDSAYSSYVSNGSYKKLQAPLNTTNKLTKNSWRHYKFVIYKNNIKVYRGGTLIIDYTDPTPIESGSFGLVNWSQPAAFANFTAACEVERDFGDVLTESTWRSDATHMIINVDSKFNESLISNPEVLTRTLSDNIYFVEWGSNENRTKAQNFISMNDNKGTFTLGANSEDYQTAVNNTVKYIESLVERTSDTQYVITGRDTDLKVTPESLKTNAIDEEHPLGRWIVHHDYTYFDNNLGQSMQTENYTKDLMLNFDKPGAYNIYFDDNLVKTVYAHRLPTADFDINISNKNITLTSSSFDEDNNEDIGYGKGIKKETWSYKKATDTTWTQGKLTTLPTDAYIIKLEVEDFQGATNYTTKYVGTGSPVAYFFTDKSQFSKYSTLTITDTSYDPSGYDITDYIWELKQNKKVIKTYTSKQPEIDFKELGAGEYSLTLNVKNSQGTSSESYTRSFTVLEDKAAPSVTIDPTFCDWKESQDIHIQIEDKDSGLDKWRYCYTQSQDEPAASQWGQWLTSSNETLTFDTDGEYYLHFEAYDKAGNKLERTVGSYKITHPYINKVTHHFGDVKTTQFATYDWGKWYNPVDEFKFDVKGFTAKSTHLLDYPTVGTTLESSTRIKQPSASINFDFYYEPIVYNVTYNYNLEGVKEVENQTTYTVLEGFTLQNPTHDEYKFIGWYLDGKRIFGINDKVSNDFDSFELFEKAMNTRTSGDIVLEARWQQEAFVERTNVYAEIPSNFEVTIPKIIVLTGSQNGPSTASYKVCASGDIAGEEIVKIIPDDFVTLSTKNKESVNGTISQEKTSWSTSELSNEEYIGTINANLSAGKWSGTFNFNIVLENAQDNHYSEENVEYKVLRYPSGMVTDYTGSVTD